MQNAAASISTFCPAAQPGSGAARRAALAPVRRWLVWAACIWLLLNACATQAWDAERMLAAARRQGPNAVQGTRALQAVLLAATGADDDTKLQAVNQFFNQRIAFREDIEVWGQLDYWASPMEMLEKGEGDCEDYAIGKYFSLLALGMPVNKLRMVYVRAQMGAAGGVVAAHMVLAYYAAVGADPLILDNLVADVRPAARRPDLAPVFSFNSEGLWQGVGSQSAGDPLARFSRWRDVLSKARAEGFQ